LQASQGFAHQNPVNFREWGLRVGKAGEK